MSKRVAIVLAANMEDSPYYYYYADILKKTNITYDIISWDRSSLGTVRDYCFDHPSPKSSPKFKKLLDFLKYSLFVKKQIVSNRYDLIIVFGIVNSIFLSKFLIKNYHKKYVVDIRDYSPIYPYVIKRLTKIFKSARQVYISSPGWKEWLPSEFNYIVSHNVKYDSLKKIGNSSKLNSKKKIIISTFGHLRDYDINKRLLNDLKNSKNYKVEFFGTGIAPLRKYANENGISNVNFGDRYESKEEQKIINRADVINILLSRHIANDGILSNRFYHAIINRKPMLVNYGNIQSEYVKTYNLGAIIYPENCIREVLDDYIGDFDPIVFEKGCNDITTALICEKINFEDSLKSILIS